jgi:hypothetical protein
MNNFNLGEPMQIPPVNRVPPVNLQAIQPQPFGRMNPPAQQIIDDDIEMIPPQMA